MRSLAVVSAHLFFFIAIAPTISAVSLVDRSDNAESNENKVVSFVDGTATENKDWKTGFNDLNFMRLGKMKKGGARAFSGGFYPYRFSDFSGYQYGMAKRMTDDVNKRGGGRAFAPSYWNSERNYGYIPYKKREYESDDVLNKMNYLLMK